MEGLRIQCGRYDWLVRDCNGRVLVETATEEEAREWVEEHIK